MRVEERSLIVKIGDRIDVPTARREPTLDPPTRSGPGVYFATSIARDSRMTITLT